MCLHQDSVEPLALTLWTLVLVRSDMSQQWVGMTKKGKWLKDTLKISPRGWSINDSLKHYLEAQEPAADSIFDIISQLVQNPYKMRFLKKAPPMMTVISRGEQHGAHNHLQPYYSV